MHLSFRIKKSTDLVFDYLTDMHKFVAVPDYTIVEEQIQFNTMLPLKPLMESIFRKQHQLLFRNIELLAP